MNNPADLTFFCEMPIETLEDLFENQEIIDKLKELRANISLGLLDYSKSRAEIVKKLTAAGIPVTAWILLPKEEGYWTSLDTVSSTRNQYSLFKKWTTENNLKWAAVGLDIEPHIGRIGMFSSRWKRYLPDLLVRLFKINYYDNALANLQTLICLIRSDGFPVETYNFPFVIEERKASSRILSRAFGTPPLDSDREVLMLYSSFLGRESDAILYSYARHTHAIGLGSTGGGVELDNSETLRSISWADLRRDLLIANRFAKHIYLFSLEGCVENGYLDQLVQMDWQSDVKIPIHSVRKYDVLRNIGTATLWMISHPFQTFTLSLFFSKLFDRKKRN